MWGQRGLYILCRIYNISGAGYAISSAGFIIYLVRDMLHPVRGMYNREGICITSADFTNDALAKFLAPHIRAHAFITRNILHTLPRSLVARSSQPESSRPFDGIRCTFRYLTEAVYTSFHPSWFQGTMARADTVCLLPLAKNAMHSYYFLLLNVL